jgi:hypothetical protein
MPARFIALLCSGLFLAAGARGADLQTAANPVADSPPLPLQSAYAFTATVKVAPIVTIGKVPAGERRFIPITGGSVSGPMLTGRVIAGSGDWQVVRSDGVISLEARYLLETSDGVRIAVFNRGVRVASPEVTARMMRGDPVAPTEYYFRTAAEFEAPLGSRYEWLNKSLFIGIAERKSDAAIVHFYQLK